MKALSPVAPLLRHFVTFVGVIAALPVAAQVSYTYTAPPPPGYPSNGAPKQPASTRSTRQSAAAVQSPSTYPNTYPPPPGYTYPPPPPGYGQPPRVSGTGTKASTAAKNTAKSTSSKKSSGPPPPAAAKPKVYGPTGDLTSQVVKISDSDKVQNMRLGELERDVSSLKRGGKGATPRYDGGTDIAPYTSYVARPGDTLFRIASTHRVSVGEIQQLNRMKADEVHVGQTLLIPSPHRSSSSTTQASYRPMTPGGEPGRQTAPPPPGAAPAKSSSAYYTVKKGDSLKAIALKHSMTTAALASANHIKDANKIIVGQRLVIPAKTAAAATPSRAPARPAQPQQESSDTVPLPGFGMADSTPSASSRERDLTPAPAPVSQPSEPAVPAPVKSAAAYDTHRGILAYRVDRSDTIEGIAHQFSTTPDRIREMNRLEADTPLKAGDEIMVPAMGAVSVGR